MMLRSANSAAVVLAEGCAGSVEAFAEHDERQSGGVGHGRHAFCHLPMAWTRTGHYSTAADMAKLARYAMQNEKFREMVAHSEVHGPIAGAAPTDLYQSPTNF